VTIDVATAWIWTVLLCAARLLPVLAFTPILNGFRVPVPVRIFIILGLAAGMSGVATAAAPTLPTDGLELGWLVASELLLGAVMSFGVHTAFGAVSFAGRLLDLQTGYALGSIFDPLTKTASSVLGSALGVLAVAMLFTMDMHHVLLRMVSHTLQVMPIGSGLQEFGVEVLIRQVSTMFSLGLSMAAPVVFLLFLFDVGMAAMSRSVPQLQVAFLSVGFKMVMALMFLVSLSSGWAYHLETLFGRMLG
jgi:flagellar biosynthetic protein FliR